MKTAFFRFLTGWIILFTSVAAWHASAQTRTLRIVCYNIEDDITNSTFHTNATTPLPGLIFPGPGGGSVTSGGVLEGIGEEVLSDGVAQPLDILALEETTSNPTTVAPIVNGMNAFYGVSNMYAMSTYQATEESGDTGDGNGPNALVYNTLTVQLVASVPVDPSGGTSKLGSSSGEYREVMRYLFAPAGMSAVASNEFYIYVSHYKSGTTSTDLKDRSEEAVIIRNNSATLPSNARIVYVGDYNVTTSSEASYQTMIASGVNQGIDPLNTSGATNIDWGTSTTNKTILAMESESSTDLRYRDDLQVMTTNIFYGTPGGLALVPGTYHVFGNNGSTPYNGSVNSGSDTALNGGLAAGSTIFASQLYTDLSYASDHLPVVADYTIPIPVPPPTAAFSASPTNGLAPLTVTFTNTSTGGITNYFWNFGDGATTNTTNIFLSHTYTSNGVFTVSELVTGSGGFNTLTRTNYLTVTAPPPPVASFVSVPTNGVVPMYVTFEDTSTGTVTNWFWDFGDGNTTNANTNLVYHLYTNAGVFTVTEIVTGPSGASTNAQVNLITMITPFQAWQLQYFGCTSCPQAQPAVDADGTGQDNQFKYIAGLDPTNAASVFVFNVKPEPNINNDPSLTFSPVVAGRIYTAQFNTDLVNGTWQTLTNVNGPFTNSGTVNLTDTNITAPAKFYRINIQLQ